MKTAVVAAIRGRSGLDPLRVVDLFAGTATVGGWMSGGSNVTAADALHFPLCVARSRLLPSSHGTRWLEDFLRLARKYADIEAREYAHLIAEEESALAEGWQRTGGLIAGAQHAGNSDSGVASDPGRFDLVRRYFARGYFSTNQAIELDALRQAAEKLLGQRTVAMSWTTASDFDRAIAAWLATASALSNSPGHTAQFLKSNSDKSYRRVLRAWSASAFAVFNRCLARVEPVGSPEWRAGNVVHLGEATVVAKILEGESVVVYADPPYTKDHYSRMYHVLETLYLYDFPDAVGVARARSDRFASDFSYRSRAYGAFSELLAATCGRGFPLVLSYPEAGMLSAEVLRELLADYGRLTVTAIPAVHSTLGGAGGKGKVDSTEYIYRVEPN